MKPRFKAQLTTPPSAPMADGELIVCRDLADLNRRAADTFLLLARQAVGARGRFAVALPGGATPKGLYSLLAAPAYRERIPWPGVHFFWSDERCVPPDHPESNHRMAWEALLSHVPVPAENIHRMPGEKDPQAAAAEYEQELKSFFCLSGDDLPRFDLILLGLGEDGHTASLFPGSEALEERKRLVVVPYVEKLKVRRLSLTLPVLNQAGHVVFLVSGKNKAAIVSGLFDKESEARNLPAQRVNSERGRLIWFVDRDAAGCLGDFKA